MNTRLDGPLVAAFEADVEGVIKQEAAEPVNPEMYLIFVKFVIKIPSKPFLPNTFLRFSCLLLYISVDTNNYSLFNF